MSGEPMQTAPFKMEPGTKEPPYLDGDGLLWVTNADDPAGDMLPPNSTVACDGLRIGPPRPTTSRTAKELADLGIVGLYGPAIHPEKDKPQQP